MKKIGIWMDHSVANTIEWSNDEMVKRTLKIADKMTENQQEVFVKKFFEISYWPLK